MHQRILMLTLFTVFLVATKCLYPDNRFACEIETLFDDDFEALVPARALAEYEASVNSGGFYDHETITGKTHTYYVPKLKHQKPERVLAVGELFSLSKFVGLVRLRIENITNKKQVLILKDLHRMADIKGALDSEKFFNLYKAMALPNRLTGLLMAAALCYLYSIIAVVGTCLLVSQNSFSAVFPIIMALGFITFAQMFLSYREKSKELIEKVEEFKEGLQLRLINASGTASKSLGDDKLAIVQLKPGHKLELMRFVDRGLYEVDQQKTPYSPSNSKA